MELTGERFGEDMLQRAEKRYQYFDKDGESKARLFLFSQLTCVPGNLFNIDELFDTPVEHALANYNILPLEEVEPAAKFIRRCIKLNPEDRPSAEALLHDSWLSS
jgi:serine/threonine-protein kinase SRPK3